ncbi:hypothetical protein [Nesterenkonia jeotgali]|uniref:PAS domain-containing protein n=1 Tax=Nesterenkonia jeotgali TaxID=317018 RepID=A0A839FSU6_9MICC|nr:hypothetical protein [Nesterenkonia jeotgali]MBA8921651.1 hypothetical protein [Nesterenkonia jeotgali]
MTRIGTFVGALLYHSSGKTFALIQQLIFLAVLASPVLLLMIFEPETSSIPGIALGLGLLIVATLAVALSPRRGLHPVLEWLVPVSSILACGICRYATYPDGAVISTLSLVPSLWLIVRFRHRGAAVAVLMVVLAISVPSLVAIQESLNFASISRYTVLPVALALMSLAVIGILQNLEASNIEAKRALVSERSSLAALERTDRLLRGVLENLNVGVLVMDVRGNDVMTNRAQREIHALASPETNLDRTEAGHLAYYTDGTPIPTQNRPAARANRGGGVRQSRVPGGGSRTGAARDLRDLPRGDRRGRHPGRRISDLPGRHEGVQPAPGTAGGHRHRLPRDADPADLHRRIQRLRRGLHDGARALGSP